MHRLTKKIKCPKCGKSPVRFIDFYIGHTVSFELLNREDMIYDEGYLEPGDHWYALAECECGHGWRLRKTISINEHLERISHES